MKSALAQIAALVACVGKYLSHRTSASNRGLTFSKATATATATPMSGVEDSSALQTRAALEDSYNVFLRKRNAHACMMSIVFIVLFPLGAISLHLPFNGLVHRVVTRIHAPIQVLGMVMMIGAMGLGIDIARNDLHLISPAHAHVVVGLLTTSLLVLLQPALGILQHLYFKKTQKKSVFAYVHRWSGRVLILLGWINSGLGFQLTGLQFVRTYSLVRNFVIMGVLGGLWFLLVGVDGYRAHWLKREKLAAFGPRWKRGVVFRKEMGGEDAIDGARD